MALPSSGQISLSEVNTELGNASNATISMGGAAVRTLFGVPSGAITMNAGHGKANEFGLTIAADASNINVATAATAAGWNGSSKLTVTINSGVYVSATSTGNAAMTISGSFPGGLFVVNNGYIVGMGGAGGNGKSISFSIPSPTEYGGTNGGAGGTALSVSSAVSFTNNGTIAGGGGGGGGGAISAGNVDPPSWNSSGAGGGGGRSGKTNSAAGVGGAASNSVGYSNYIGNSGTAGTYTSAGSGGAQYNWYCRHNGAGGAGGGWGAGGSGGGSGWGDNTGTRYGTGGGSAGACLTGNSNITWVATGTRLGSIS